MVTYRIQPVREGDDDNNDNNFVLLNPKVNWGYLIVEAQGKKMFIGI